MTSAPVITMESVERLRAMAKEANAMAHAFYEAGHRAAANEATEAALSLASASHALQRDLEPAQSRREGR